MLPRDSTSLRNSNWLKSYADLVRNYKKYGIKSLYDNNNDIRWVQPSLDLSLVVFNPHLPRSLAITMNKIYELLEWIS